MPSVFKISGEASSIPKGSWQPLQPWAIVLPSAVVCEPSRHLKQPGESVCPRVLGYFPHMTLKSGKTLRLHHKNHLTGLAVLGARSVNVGVARLIKTNDRAWQFVSCFLAGTVVAFRASIPLFLTYGKVTAISPRAKASSMACSGSSKVCVGRLWQSTHCMSYLSNVSAELI
jgi:hypothetical protein